MKTHDIAEKIMNNLKGLLKNKVVEDYNDGTDYFYAVLSRQMGSSGREINDNYNWSKGEYDEFLERYYDCHCVPLGQYACDVDGSLECWENDPKAKLWNDDFAMIEQVAAENPDVNIVYEGIKGTLYLSVKLKR